MSKYKVLQYFQWGKLQLDKGQILIIEPHNAPDASFAQDASLVTVEHYPDKQQLVATRAIENQIKLKKIERY